MPACVRHSCLRRWRLGHHPGPDHPCHQNKRKAGRERTTFSASLSLSVLYQICTGHPCDFLTVRFSAWLGPFQRAKQSVSACDTVRFSVRFGPFFSLVLACSVNSCQSVRFSEPLSCPELWLTGTNSGTNCSKQRASQHLNAKRRLFRRLCLILHLPAAPSWHFLENADGADLAFLAVL